MSIVLVYFDPFLVKREVEREKKLGERWKTFSSVVTPTFKGD